MHHLSSEVGQVAQGEDKQWLNDAHVICVLGDKTTNHSVHHANECSAQGNDEEGANARSVVNHLNVGLTNFRVALHHVVQNLHQSISVN